MCSGKPALMHLVPAMHVNIKLAFFLVDSYWLNTLPRNSSHPFIFSSTTHSQLEPLDLLHRPLTFELRGRGLTGSISLAPAGGSTHRFALT